MAGITRHDRGYRAQVARRGVRRSRVFSTRQQARDWAARAEFEIMQGGKVAAAMSFGDLMDRYARERSPAKRGARWEIIRIEQLRRDPLAAIAIGDLGAADFASWRDRRLREVAPASVAREMQLNSVV